MLLDSSITMVENIEACGVRENNMVLDIIQQEMEWKERGSGHYRLISILRKIIDGLMF